MKNLKNYISSFVLTLLIVAFTSCGDDDNNQDEDVFAGCCSDDPVFGPNVDNLDHSIGGEISVSDIVTPNGDGNFDLFGVINIENYPNHTVTIYNSEDEIVLESNNYGSSTNEIFPWLQASGIFEAVDGIADGTYKYKVVIEDEQTFFKSGTFCLFTNDPVVEQQNFSECLDAGEFDPILTGF
jgi:hypothetical protein